MRHSLALWTSAALSSLGLLAACSGGDTPELSQSQGQSPIPSLDASQPDTSAEPDTSDISDTSDDGDTQPQQPCQTDSECSNDALGACVEARCNPTTFVCETHQIEGCCTTNSDCESQAGTCSRGFCTDQSQCAFEAVDNCCAQDSDCTSEQACFTAACVDQACTLSPIENCCTEDSDCQVDSACSVGACNLEAGRCEISQVPGCCESASDCSDGQVCTLDSCVDHQCVHTDAPNCCTQDSECNDGSLCTDDACVDNVCSNVRRLDCCESASDCRDASSCTLDLCINNSCRHEAILNCCESDADCSADSVCTIPTCEGGFCSLNLNPDCCILDLQCNDNDACTTDACVNNVCQNTDIANCCVTDSDCDDGNACTTDSCQANRCQHTSLSCDDNRACTTDSCDPSLGCVFNDSACPVCEPQTLMSESFASTTPTFTNSNPNNSVRWRILTTRSVSSPNAMHFSNNNGSNYASGPGGNNRTQGTATFPAIAIPEAIGSASLTFKAHVNIDASPDVFKVEMVMGNSVSTIWTYLPAQHPVSTWFDVSLALPANAKGNNIQIRFNMDSGVTQQQGNRGTGVTIDDIVVKTLCP